LEVVIGLVFIYLLLSMFCTVVNEFVARVMTLRANNLKEGIEQILGDPLLRDAFYNHPAIRSLKGKDGKLPSYISPTAFSAVIKDLAGGYENIRRFATGAADAVFTIETAAAKLLGPAGVAAAGVVAGGAAGGAAVAAPNADHLAQLLRSVIGNGLPTREQIEQRLAAHFDEVMDRVSGWYKRNIQFWTRIIALLVAVVVNADSVNIATVLWNDPGTRAAVVKMAETAVISCADTLKAQANRPQTDQEAKKEDKSGKQTSSIMSACPQVKDVVGGDASRRTLPFGWYKDYEPLKSVYASSGVDLGNVAAWLFGILATALAISLGAPFWFDLLQKFMQVRSSGGASTTSPAAKPKDPHEPVG
jgi:hypothetical protein